MPPTIGQVTARRCAWKVRSVFGFLPFWWYCPTHASQEPSRRVTARIDSGTEQRAPIAVWWPQIMPPAHVYWRPLVSRCTRLPACRLSGQSVVGRAIPGCHARHDMRLRSSQCGAPTDFGGISAGTGGPEMTCQRSPELRWRSRRLLGRGQADKLQNASLLVRGSCLQPRASIQACYRRHGSPRCLTGPLKVDAGL